MRKASIAVLVCLAAGLIVLSGCASIMCGDHKTINVSSQPSGVEFKVVNAKGKIIVESVTPTNVTLKRGRGWFQAADYTVRFSKAGYRELTVPIKQGMETGWYLGGNLIFGGLVGILIVDPLTGAMWAIKDLDVTLHPDAREKEAPKAPLKPPSPNVGKRVG